MFDVQCYSRWFTGLTSGLTLRGNHPSPPVLNSTQETLKVERLHQIPSAPDPRTPKSPEPCLKKNCNRSETLDRTAYAGAEGGRTS